MSDRGNGSGSAGGGGAAGGGGGSTKGAFHDYERFEDEDEATRQEAEGQQSKMWTAMPIIIKKHDREKNTVHAVPAFKLNHLKEDGTSEWKEVAKMEDLPVFYYGGGGASITTPVKDGDEALAVVSSRSIDKWWAEGGVQEQSHSRMHNMTDSFILPGFRSQKTKLKDVSEKSWQLRSEDGKSFVDFNPGSGESDEDKKRNYTINIEDAITIKCVNGKITITAKGAIDITSEDKVTIKGTEIILDGTVRLGGASASNKVAKQGTVDSDGDTLVSNLSDTVFTK
jgi:hypothetical protein